MTATRCHRLPQPSGRSSGTAKKEALGAAHKGAGKAEILERYGCVVGVADVSFTVRPGEIFCVMGLSGSANPPWSATSIA